MKSSMIAALSLAMFAAGAANAQSTNMKIGVVNVAQLLQEAPQAKAVEDKLKDEFGPRQREITTMRQALQTQTETFQRDAPVMGEAERLNLERQIRDAQRDLQRAENEYVEDLNVRRNEELGTLQRVFIEQVQNYARSAQFDLILTDALYFSQGVDITPQVLAALQTQGGSGSSSSERPPARSSGR